MYSAGLHGHLELTFYQSIRHELYNISMVLYHNSDIGPDCTWARHTSKTENFFGPVQFRFGRFSSENLYTAIEVKEVGL
jgi:hypothetical protein